MQLATECCCGMQAADAKGISGRSRDSRAEEPVCERGQLAGQAIIGVLESSIAEFRA